MSLRTVWLWIAAITFAFWLLFAVAVMRIA